MNCRRFEELVNDIARAQIIDVGVRDEAVAHTRACEQCERRLEAERQLTSHLKGLAAAGRSIDPPEPVSARLLAAFDRQAPLAPRRFAGIKRRSWGAIAAALLLSIGLFAGMVLRWRRSAPVMSGDGKLAVTNPLPPAKEPDPSPVTPIAKRKAPPRVTPGPGRRLTHRHDLDDSTNGNEAMSHHSREVATDFFVINYGVATLAEGGRVVRLLVPRSAMARFGLPVNMDRVNEPVKADVVLGIDGLPHAIRFVQEISSTANPRQAPAPQADVRKQRKEKKS